MNLTGLPLFDICSGRHRGAPTSRLAQLDRVAHAAQQRARVHQAILEAGAAGLIVDELSARWSVPPNSISGRFSELKAGGLLRIVELRRTRAGSSAMAYAAVGQP